MSGTRRFLFDTSFDEDAPWIEEEEPEPEEPPEPPPPTFGLEELEAVREEAFAAGREEGLREAAVATERLTADVEAVIGEQVGRLFALQAEANRVALEDAVAVAVAITRKVFPTLEARQGADEVRRVIESALELVLDEPKVVIKVPPAQRDPVAARTAALAAAIGFEGRIVVLDEPGLATGDCLVEWGNGGAERDTAQMWQEIDGIIERSFEAVDQTPAGAADGDAAAGDSG